MTHLKVQYVILFVLILIKIETKAQKDISILNPDALLPIEVGIPTNKDIEKVITLKHIKSIEWVDIRLDTFSIGLGVHKDFLGKKTAYRLIPEGGLVPLFNKTTNSLANTDSNAGFTARIYIHNIWLNRAGDFETSRTRKDNLILNDRMYIKGDVFIRNEDHFYALFRIDTTIILKKNLFAYDPSNRRIDEASGTHFENGTKRQLSTTSGEGIIFILNKLSNVDALSVSSRKTAAKEQEINDYFTKIQYAKILTGQVITRGVFRSFSAFKNAEIENVEFKLVSDKKVQHLEVKNPAGDWEIERNVFGFFDGERQFIKSGDMYFPLVKVQNSYYYWGTQEITTFKNDPLFQGVPQIMSTHEFRPLKLDLISGKIME
jgi:hypothetical protein